MRSVLFGWIVAMVVLASCTVGESRVIVAGGTTLVDSGFLDALAGEFESAHPDIELSIVGNPTSLVLELGRQHAADLLITHAPGQEAEFIAEGLSEISRHVLDSRFLLVGPAELRSRFAGLEIPEVLRLVFEEELPFVSRADGSGTNDAEREAWLEAGLNPSGQPWYIETGQGMGPTLLVADQRGAMTLAEEGAFVAASDVLRIVDIQVVGEGLENPYTATVVAGSHGGQGARAFLDWLVSEQGRDSILEVNQRLFGMVIYGPAPSG